MGVVNNLIKLAKIVGKGWQGTTLADLETPNYPETFKKREIIGMLNNNVTFFRVTSGGNGYISQLVDGNWVYKKTLGAFAGTSVSLGAKTDFTDGDTYKVTYAPYGYGLYETIFVFNEDM